VIWVVALVVTAFVVAAIGLVAVGGVTARLSAEPPSTVFDLDQAVPWVADRLDPETQARLTYEDVDAVLVWHLDYLEDRGVATERFAPAAAAGPSLVADDEGIAWIIGRVDATGLDISDDDVVEVLEAAQAYLETIGAIGGRVDGMASGPSAAQAPGTSDPALDSDLD
jgi:hypothetical protein